MMLHSIYVRINQLAFVSGDSVQSISKPSTKKLKSFFCRLKRKQTRLPFRYNAESQGNVSIDMHCIALYGNSTKILDKRKVKSMKN